MSFHIKLKYVWFFICFFLAQQVYQILLCPLLPLTFFSYMKIQIHQEETYGYTQLETRKQYKELLRLNCVFQRFVPTHEMTNK